MNDHKNIQEDFNNGKIEISAIRHFLEFSESVVKEAGKFVAAKWEMPLKVYPKGYRDIYTDADIETQNLIAKLILSKFPNHAFLTEEPNSNLPSEGDYLWIIDPIDGSINFSKKQPIFSISIALAINNSLHVGVIYDPLHDELFSAATQLGFRLNGNIIQPEPNSNLAQAVIGFDWNDSNELRAKELKALVELGSLVRTINVLGSAALSLSWVAMGRLDGYYNYHLDAWDVAAGYVMLREIGKDIIHFSGNPWEWRSKDKTCIAGSSTICSEIRGFVQNIA